MQKTENGTGFTFEQQAEAVVKALDDAERILKVEKKAVHALSAVTLAEHHIFMAERLAKNLSHEEKLRNWRKRAKDIRRRCGLLWRLVARVMQL